MRESFFMPAEDIAGMAHALAAATRLHPDCEISVEGAVLGSLIEEIAHHRMLATGGGCTCRQCAHDRASVGIADVLIAAGRAAKGSDVSKAP